MEITIWEKIDFTFFNIMLPIILSVLYSKNVNTNKINYNLTKGCWYLVYASVVAFDYLVKHTQRYVAGFTVTLAIMEGLPLILIPLLNINNKSKSE